MADTKRPVAEYEGNGAHERAERKAAELREQAQKLGYDVEPRVIKDEVRNVRGQWRREVTWGVFVKAPDQRDEQQQPHKRRRTTSS